MNRRRKNKHALFGALPHTLSLSRNDAARDAARPRGPRCYSLRSDRQYVNRDMSERGAIHESGKCREGLQKSTPLLTHVTKRQEGVLHRVLCMPDACDVICYAAICVVTSVVANQMSHCCYPRECE